MTIPDQETHTDTQYSASSPKNNKTQKRNVNKFTPHGRKLIEVVIY